MNPCPICSRPAASRTPAGEMTCPAGHGWHLCPLHMRAVLMPIDLTGPGVCSCPPAAKTAARRPTTHDRSGPPVRC